MGVIGIIPARYASTRFPGKALVVIQGKPMIQHVYERARQVKELDQVVVATDDERIVEAVRSFGGEALLTRGDHASGTDRLAEASRLLDLRPSDEVINIQGDEPLIQPVMIEALIRALHEPMDCPMATLAFESRNVSEYYNANVVKVVVDKSWKALYFSRAPVPFHREAALSASFLKHLGFYAYRREFLDLFTGLPRGRLEELEKLEQLRALEHGHPVRVALSPVETLGVDTPGDLEEVLRLMEERKEEGEKLRR